jgi:hypothetical protein
MTINNRIQKHYSFLIKSIEANNGRGSSAYFSRVHHPLKGWSKPYPETTGYLIPTLIQLQEQEQIEVLPQIESCMSWLVEDVQFKDGGFPSLYADNTKPSLFNSTQIALGFEAYSKINKKYEQAEIKLMNWLDRHLIGGNEGIHYKGNFIPTYYTRVVWPCLLLSQKHENSSLREGAEKLLRKLLLRIDKDYFPLESGFQGDIAYTHTLAYTVRGFLESGLLLMDSKLLDLTQQQIDAQIKCLKFNDLKFAGRYSRHWVGDYSLRCLTGEWQWIIIFLKAYQLFDKQEYFDIASQTIKRLNNDSILYPKGAVTGSSPFWGSYMRLKAPNWAAKFALDALLLYKKLENGKG